MISSDARQEWVLLSYRIPREPSTARISVWRKLKDLGVAKLGDGLVALPHDARTREHLEWMSASVVEAGGEATVWLATPGSRHDTERIAADMRRARESEYRELIEEVAAVTAAGGPPDGRTLARLRRRLRQINRRDHFRASARDEARRSVEALAVVGAQR